MTKKRKDDFLVYALKQRGYRRRNDSRSDSRNGGGTCRKDNVRQLPKDLCSEAYEGHEEEHRKAVVPYEVKNLTPRKNGAFHYISVLFSANFAFTQIVGEYLLPKRK